jgi:flagellar biosynthesis/type III secretory pathway protein FliH
MKKDGTLGTAQARDRQAKAKSKAKGKAKGKPKSKAKAKAKAKKKRMKDFIEATTNYRDPFKPSSPPPAKYKKQFKGGKDLFR